MTYRHFFKIVILSATVIMFSYTVTMYLYDPLHIFSNPQGLYSDKMRYQAVSYLKDDGIDGIILGTSMLENTDQVETSEILGGHFVNISMRGSTFAERRIVLDYALRNYRISKVIGSLDMFPYMTEPLSSTQQWYKLYDRNVFNDITVYYDKTYLKCLFSSPNSPLCVGFPQNPRRPPEWMHLPIYVNSFNGICSWPDQSKQILFQALLNVHDSAGNVEYDSVAMGKMIDKNIISLIRDYQDVSFYYLVPPYSALSHRLSPSDLEWQKRFIRQVSYACASYENCKLYGFGDLDFTTDIRNYKDLNHYSDKYNSMMIKAVAKDEHILKPAILDEYFEKVELQAKKVDASAVRTELSGCLPDAADKRKLSDN